ncbi:hypothetical protein LSAT2_015520 [Lamellibrachia satsuma]|nr:hypothetical protein LSAT2_015520 [Lamellibrachia satsuma]
MSTSKLPSKHPSKSESLKSDIMTMFRITIKVLKEEELDKLDELYQLISPSREDNRSYDEQLTEASDHIQNYLDNKDKEVAGTTYKALHDLVTRIEGCSYFDSISRTVQLETLETQSAEEELVQEVAVQAEFAEVDIPHEQPTETSPIDTQENEPEILEDVHSPTANTREAERSPPTEVQKTNMLEATEAGFDDSSFFSTVSINRPRQFKEIVSSVQGNFDFLQESQIELEHSKRAQAGYQNKSLVSGAAVDQSVSHFTAPQHLTQSQLTHTAMQEPATEALQQSAPQQQQYTDSLITSQATNESLVSQQGVLDSYASPEQGFGQNHMNLQVTSSSHSFSEQASKLAAQMTSIDPSVVMPSADGPQPIPMPNETIPGQSLTVQGFTDTQGQGDQLSPDSQEKKPFSMNPNADIFRSMYPQQAMSVTQQQQAVGQLTNSAGGPPMPSAHDSKFYSQSMQASDYPSGTFGGSSYVRGGGARRGGQGRGSRGGSGGPGNSFSRSGTNNRGGVASFNMPRGGGGNFQNNRGNSRGGGGVAFQGYTQRIDVRPDTFQSYSNGYPSASNFSKRGGNASARGPNVRGSGVIRSGGPPRGARGNNGGPSRGGYSRPNSGGVAPQAVQQA